MRHAFPDGLSGGRPLLPYKQRGAKFGSGEDTDETRTGNGRKVERDEDFRGKVSQYVNRIVA